jgi:hypothetical protein
MIFRFNMSREDFVDEEEYNTYLESREDMSESLK